MIPVESIEKDRLAIVGTSGSGKSYLAMSLVEQLMAMGRRVVVVDPLGAWFGLRLLPDGSPSPFKPVIFGGAHGDIAITENSGQIIGETVAASADSCIIDLSQFGVSAVERRFMLAFLKALYAKTAGAPVHLVLDEADMWAPQVILDRDGDSARLLGMVETIVRRGRIKGFRPWQITQRPASLNKNVMSQADGLIAMKLTASQDRNAIGAWVEGQADKGQWKDISANLPTLERGTGVVWLPSRGILETMSFGKKLTFDSSRTPEHGENFDAVKLVPIDIGALREKLSGIEAETKASDPKILKAEIAWLKSEIQKHIVSAATGITQEIINQKTQAAYSTGYTDGRDAAWNFAAVEMRAKIIDVITNIDAPKDPAPREITPAQSRLPKPVAAPMAVGTKVDGRGIAPNKVAPPSTEQGLSPSARRVVNAIHNSYPLALSFDAAARRVGLSKRSSAYRKYRDEVWQCVELVQRDDGKLTSQQIHIKADRAVESGGVDMWVSKLPPSIGKMLKAIADGYQDKATIASVAGISPTSSGLGSGLRELVQLELIVADGGNYTLAEGL